MRLRYLLLLAPFLMATEVGIWHQTFDATNVAAPSNTIPHVITYDVRDSSPGTTASFVTTPQGITFTFDAAYQVGTFVDGQPWVVPNVSGGAVNVISTSPAYNASTRMNGYEVNAVSNSYRPVPNGATVDGVTCSLSGGCGAVHTDFRSAFDGHIFVSPLNVTYGYGPMPLGLIAGKSLYKVISRTTDYGFGCTSTGMNGDQPRTCIDSASVLTVLANPPPADSFRPPYVGTVKPVFSASAINPDTMLPSLPLLASNQTTVADSLDIFGANHSVLTVHGRGYRWEYINPRRGIGRVGDTLPGTGDMGYVYGCQMGQDNQMAALRTLQTLSPGDTAAMRRELILGLVQRGIDFHYITSASVGARNWANSGGCVTPGIKPLIMYAGYLLQASGQSPPTSMVNGSLAVGDEDANSYWSATCNLGAGCGLQGDISKSCYTLPLTSCDDMRPCCDGLRDGGNCASASIGAPGCDATSCANEGSPKEAQRSISDILADGQYTLGSYQDYMGPKISGVTVARILRFDDEWQGAATSAGSAFFSKMDRMAAVPYSDPGTMNMGCHNTCSDYVEWMYYTYGCTSAGCIAARAW